MSSTRSRRPLWLLVLIGWLLWPAAARAYPVNAEKLLVGPTDEGWDGSLSTTVALMYGNVNRLNLGFSGGLSYRNLYPHGAGYRGPVPEGAPPFFRDRWVLITDASFVRVALQEVVNRGFAHTRYTRMWRPRVGTEGFAQAQYNEFTRLKLRALGGVGMRFDFINRQHLQTWGGTGYMLEGERNRVDPADPHPANLLNHRWTSYGVVQLQLWDSAFRARNTTYIQPLLTNFVDFRILEAMQLEAKSGPVAVGIELELQYDNRPPTFSGVLPLDMFLGSYVRVGGS